jgi:hypothetical protein
MRSLLCYRQARGIRDAQLQQDWRKSTIVMPNLSLEESWTSR